MHLAMPRSSTCFARARASSDALVSVDKVKEQLDGTLRELRPDRRGSWNTVLLGTRKELRAKEG